MVDMDKNNNPITFIKKIKQGTILEGCEMSRNDKTFDFSQYYYDEQKCKLIDGNILVDLPTECFTILEPDIDINLRIELEYDPMEEVQHPLNEMERKEAKEAKHENQAVVH